MATCKSFVSGKNLIKQTSVGHGLKNSDLSLTSDEHIEPRVGSCYVGRVVQKHC